MSLMVTGRSQISDEWNGICTPSGGYRVLAYRILWQAVEEMESGDIVTAEQGLSSLLSKRAETYFALLDIDPSVAIQAILLRNGLELANGNGAR